LLQEAALLVACGLIDGTSSDHIAGVNYEFKGVAVLVDSDSDDDSACEGTGDAGKQPPGCASEGLAEAASPGGEASSSAAAKEAVSALPAEPPSVAELLKAVSKPPFNLVAASTAAPAASSSSADGAAPPAASDAVPPPARAKEAAATAGAAVATRCGKGLVDPTDWNQRHEQLLAAMPKEALPPAVPHGHFYANVAPSQPNRTDTA
jgi:hypothetical protein